MGEAWKGRDYGGIDDNRCLVCLNFSMNKFILCVGDEESFETVKQNFVTHFNEAHIK